MLTQRKFISLFLSFCLIFEQSAFAQSIDLSHYFANSGKPILPGDKFRPLHLRYLGYDNLSNDFKILLDKGDTKKEDLDNKNYLEENTQTLLKYFFIGLALPNEKFWVNLRPDSPDNILDPDLEKTDIGRIFLEADVQLKKDTAGMTSPQTPEGKAYWDKLYQKAGELFGTENITIPTITRPWIVPNEIIIREAPDNAYIYKATLKVMLEEDYLKSSQLSAVSHQQYEFKDPRLKELNEYSTRLIKETIIPKLTYEVNTSKRYAPLRQVYYSLILAQWFKQKYGSFGSTSASANNYIDLIDSGNITNLTSSQPYDKQSYFQQYKKSFQEGEYNLQEPVYTPMGQSIRRYMSGGMKFDGMYSSSSIIPAGKKEFVPVNTKNVMGAMANSSLSEPADYKKKLPLFVGTAALFITTFLNPKEIFADKYFYNPTGERIEQIVEVEQGDTLTSIFEQISLANGIKYSVNAGELIEKLEEDNPGIEIQDNIPPGTRLKIHSAVDFLLLKDALSIEVVAQKDVNIGGKNVKIYFINSLKEQPMGGGAIGRAIGNIIIVDIKTAIDEGISRSTAEFAVGINLSDKLRDSVDTMIGGVRDVINHEVMHQSKINEMIFKGAVNEEVIKLKSPTFSKNIPDKVMRIRILQELSAFLWEAIKSKDPRGSLKRVFSHCDSEDTTYKITARVLKEMFYREYMLGGKEDRNSFYPDEWARLDRLMKNSYDKDVRFIDGRSKEGITWICGRLFKQIFGAFPEIESEVELWDIREYLLNTFKNKRSVNISGKMLNQIFGQKEKVWIEGHTVEEMLKYIEDQFFKSAKNFKPAEIKGRIRVYANGKEIKNGFPAGNVELKSTGRLVRMNLPNDENQKMQTLETQDIASIYLSEYFLRNILWPAVQEVIIANSDKFKSGILPSASNVLNGSGFNIGKIVKLCGAIQKGGFAIGVLSNNQDTAAVMGILARLISAQVGQPTLKRKSEILDEEGELLNKLPEAIDLSVKILSELGKQGWENVQARKVFEQTRQRLNDDKRFEEILKVLITNFFSNNGEETFPAVCQEKDFNWPEVMPIAEEILKKLNFGEDPKGMVLNDLRLYNEMLKRTAEIHEKSSSSPVDIESVTLSAEDNLSASSAAEIMLAGKIVSSDPNSRKGGIAFNALPIQIQQIKSLQSLSASPLSINPNFDLGAEWAQIQQVFNAGIRPSVQRLVEFSAVAASSPAESRRADDVLGLIAELLRREEESQKFTPTDPVLKGLLNALEVWK